MGSEFEERTREHRKGGFEASQVRLVDQGQVGLFAQQLFDEGAELAPGVVPDHDASGPEPSEDLSGDIVMQRVHPTLP